MTIFQKKTNLMTNIKSFCYFNKIRIIRKTLAFINHLTYEFSKSMTYSLMSYLFYLPFLSFAAFILERQIKIKFFGIWIVQIWDILSSMLIW